ncbi:SipW-dependent-type signal peptide-containing protein [Nocardioides bruguierae]|uniref:SipW-dependent-type signal peptide-containing protein n=1 Tax=Nocardioides bruguierae TaxID=2945102 RepID=UPI00201FFBBE|nr:SipW-dependent-type signal peptide-containing protein [Nocardioides bruguierae]MCL8027367.1 SipW-dependent-type signal peptide-containing protein [Nocardioides bruguierae]
MPRRAAPAHRARSSGRTHLRRAAWLLGLALVALLVVRPTWAAWTDSAQLTGTTVTAGTLDLRLDGADSRATTTLSMPVMVPGSSSAELVSVQNNGTAKLTWTFSGSLSGTGASAYASASALTVTVRSGATVSGSGSAATCSGGTALASSVALGTTSTSLVTAQGPLAAGGSTSVCVQVTLDAAAPSTLMGATASVALTAGASSVVS